jgi:hypothetical protein
MNPRLALAAARYLCYHRSVGLYRLVDDLLKESSLLPVFAELGAVEVVGGAPAAPRPDTAEWWKAHGAVKDAVLYLETRGVVKYLSQLEVVNWIGKTCSSPTPTHISPPPENFTAAADGEASNCKKAASAQQKVAKSVQNGGRKRRTLVDYL